MAARLPSERRSKNPFPPTNPFSSKYESPSRRESVDTFPPTNPFSAHHSRRRHHHHHSHPRRRTRSVVEPDLIDRLDPWQYHHEGPFDAVNRALNTIPDRSPIEAVRSSNEEALRATPLHNISDALERHRPLEGVAYYPPGSTDPYGKTYDYEEGSNMNSVERGNFMRIHGFKFTDEDFKNDPFYQRMTEEDRIRKEKAERRLSNRFVPQTLLRRWRSRRSAAAPAPAIEQPAKVC